MTKYLNIGDRLRKILLDNPQGMTIVELSKADGSPQDAIISALYRGYGFYIGGWSKFNSVHLRAVWMVVRVPERAPKPAGYDDVTEKEAELQRKRIEYRRRQLADRDKLDAIRKKLRQQRDEERERHAEVQAAIKAERKAVREQERIQREQRRAQIAAEKAAKKEKAYVPEKTFWQPVKPWPTQGASA